MRKKTVIVEIAYLLAAIENCRTRADENATAWGQRHALRLSQICKEYLPSGSGIDSGTTLSEEKSTPVKIVFETSFHHMNESGCS